MLPEPEKFIQECFPLTEQASVQKPPAELVPAAANFRITDDDHGSFGPKGRYVLNVEAIQVLRNIESEGRAATDVEQEMLSRYAELKSLLTKSEYASARASTLNAHFTPPVVIRAIYEALGSMGFQSGKRDSGTVVFRIPRRP